MSDLDSGAQAIRSALLWHIARAVSEEAVGKSLYNFRVKRNDSFQSVSVPGEPWLATDC